MHYRNQNMFMNTRRRARVTALLVSIIVSFALSGQAQASNGSNPFAILTNPLAALKRQHMMVLEGGLGVTRFGSVDYSASGRGRLGGTVLFGEGPLTAGPGFMISLQHFRYQDRDGTNGSLLLNFGAHLAARYELNERVAIIGELGLGLIFSPEITPGNDFIEDRQRLKANVGLLEYRAVATITYRILRNTHVNLSSGLAYAGTREPFVREVPSLINLHFTGGFSWIF